MKSDRGHFRIGNFQNGVICLQLLKFLLFFFSSSNFVIKDLHDSDCSSHRKPYPIEHSPVLYTLQASYLQRTITGDRGSLTSTDGAGGLEKDTVNLVASFETALVVMPEKKEGKAKEIHLLHIPSANNIPEMYMFFSFNVNTQAPHRFSDSCFQIKKHVMYLISTKIPPKKSLTPSPP